MGARAVYGDIQDRQTWTCL